MAISEINDKSLAASAVNLATNTVTGILPAANTVANFSPGNNVIINGAMQVAQRATSATGLGGGTDSYPTCDRFKVSQTATAGRYTMTQTADGPSGFANCIKLDCTTADTSIASNEYFLIRQRIEGQNIQMFAKGTSDAKQYALSFYVKGNANATYVAELMDNSNSNRHVNKTFAVTTSWTRIEIIFPADTTGVIGDTNTADFDLNIWLNSGSDRTSGTLQQTWGALAQANRAVGISSFFSSTDNNFFITGLQLEVGPVATPFEHRSFGQELALCQRYFQKTYDYATAPAASTENGWAWYGADYDVGITSTFQSQGIRFESTMRAAPTMVGYDASGNSGKCVRYRVGAGPAANIASSIDLITTKNFRHFGQGTNATGNIAFHYTADAEL